MKKLLLPVLLIISLGLHVSCNSNQEDQAEKEYKEIKDSLPNPAPTAGHFWWEAQLNMGPKMIMNQKDALPDDSLNITAVLRRMNTTYPDVIVEELNRTNDTVTVKIPKSRYLTEQMGSTGALAYLAELTYNLTEIPGIRCVSILFKAGDHASPDIYTRKDFENGGF